MMRAKPKIRGPAVRSHTTDKGRFDLWRSRRGKAHTRLCGEGLYYLVIITLVFTGALIREVNLLLILAGMLTGPLLFSWWLSAVSLRRLVIRRKMPRGICAGDLLVVHLELTNPRERRRSWTVVVEDAVEQANDHLENVMTPEVLFTQLAPGQSRTQAYRGRLVGRGSYQFGPLKLSTRFPFGMIRRTIEVDQFAPLFVYPRLGYLTPRWYARHRDAFEGTSRRNSRHHRTQGDLYGVREWRHGDNRRWVHWRSSAKHDRLVVCQFEQQRNRDMAILIDLWIPNEPRIEDFENVELAVSFAASVATDVCRKGGVSLWIGGIEDQGTLLGGPASMALLQELMERLSNVQAEKSATPDLLIDRTLTQIDPGTEMVLVSPRALDLNDSLLFPALFRDAKRQAASGRIRQIDTSSDRLADFFLMEPTLG